jgi:glycerol 2-dehydrogenase (NADP+)
VNQIELHPNNPSPKLVAYNTSKGIHSTGYSCLGSTNSPLYKDETLLSIAKNKGKTPQQVLLAWGIQKGWSVIPKSVNKDRVETNFELDDFELTDEEVNKLDNLKDRFKVCGGMFYISFSVPTAISEDSCCKHRSLTDIICSFRCVAASQGFLRR